MKHIGTFALYCRIGIGQQIGTYLGRIATLSDLFCILVCFTILVSRIIPPK